MAKIEIKRFSLHQNAKVFSIMLFVTSLVLLVPMAIILAFAPIEDGHGGPMAFMILIFPFIYLVAGYVTVALGCALYNSICKYTGGIEYEAQGNAAPSVE